MKTKRTKQKGITLIALVITIIVLLILAGVSIAMLTGQNGILTQANNAKIEQSHAAIKDSLSLAYNEYQILINTASTEKIASTEKVTIKGEEENYLANSDTFMDFLLAKGYIEDTTTGKIVVEKLTGAKQALGNGTGETDIYKVEEENGIYVVNYYDNEGTPEEIWNASSETAEGEEEIDWDKILEEATEKHPQQTESNDIGIGTDGQLVDLDLWYYEPTDDGNGYDLPSRNIGSNTIPAYMGDITTDGKIEGTVPQYIKEEGGEFLPVTQMTGAFSECRELVIAPKIPDTVTSMIRTFSMCYKLEKAPEIPKLVTDMTSTFSSCSKLTEAPILPDNVTNLSDTFQETKLINAPIIPDSVKNMSSTFYDCRELINAPLIPEGTTNMRYTFYMCGKLEKAPRIPENVEDMEGTFMSCNRLTEYIVIDANPTSYEDCFYGAATDPNADLILTGSSTILQELLETKSRDSKITIGQKNN